MIHITTSGTVILFSGDLKVTSSFGALKEVNTYKHYNGFDEEHHNGVSESMGNRAITEKTETPEIIKEKLREKIWRKSHSRKSVKTFNDTIRSFEKFLQYRKMNYQHCLTEPIQMLDEYASWLDKDHSPRTTSTYVYYVKKTLKSMGAKIDPEEFKENVTMPKVRPFQDDKVSKDQIRKIILGLKHLALKTVLMLMKDTQARPGEITGLQVSDLNLSYDPPYLNIPAERAKNDSPRELFFTNETKESLLSYIKRENKGPTDFLYLQDVDPLDEKELQRKIERVVNEMGKVFRALLFKPDFEDLRQTVKQRGAIKRYKIHMYSFKKFAFTVMADTLGEIATRAIKGDREYVFTYYRKSREERADDYRKVMPKLVVFAADERSKTREGIEVQLRSMGDGELARLQEFLKNCKNQARE